VFVTNMSIDAPIKIGLGPDDLLKRNARLIYAHSSAGEEKAPMPATSPSTIPALPAPD